MVTRRKQLHGQTRRAVLSREQGGLTEPPAPPRVVAEVFEPEPEPDEPPSLPRFFTGVDGHDDE